MYSYGTGDFDEQYRSAGYVYASYHGVYNTKYGIIGKPDIDWADKGKKLVDKMYENIGGINHIMLKMSRYWIQKIAK